MKTLPSDPIKAHPGHKYPKFVQALTTVPPVLKAPTDLQKGVSERRSLVVLLLRRDLSPQARLARLLSGEGNGARRQVVQAH
jgi:hypothetical protein